MSNHSPLVAWLKSIKQSLAAHPFRTGYAATTLAAASCSLLVFFSAFGSVFRLEPALFAFIASIVVPASAISAGAYTLLLAVRFLVSNISLRGQHKMWAAPSHPIEQMSTEIVAGVPIGLLTGIAIGFWFVLLAGASC